MSDPVFGKCKDCIAATPLKDPTDLKASKLKCQRHPPLPTNLAVPQGNGRVNIMNFTSWPIVEAENGCFEFIPKVSLAE